TGEVDAVVEGGDEIVRGEELPPRDPVLVGPADPDGLDSLSLQPVLDVPGRAPLVLAEEAEFLDEPPPANADDLPVARSHRLLLPAWCGVRRSQDYPVASRMDEPRPVPTERSGAAPTSDTPSRTCRRRSARSNRRSHNDRS